MTPRLTPPLLFQEDRLLPGLTAARQIGVVLPRGEKVPRRGWMPSVWPMHPCCSRKSCPAECGGRWHWPAAWPTGSGKKLLLLDEPFTGIDPERCRSIMAFIRKMDLPVLCSAHDAETLALADRIIYLDGPPLHRTPAVENSR